MEVCSLHCKPWVAGSSPASDSSHGLGEADDLDTDESLLDLALYCWPVWGLVPSCKNYEVEDASCLGGYRMALRCTGQVHPFYASVPWHVSTDDSCWGQTRCSEGPWTWEGHLTLGESPCFQTCGV